jgi:hypothetical protein
MCCSILEVGYQSKLEKIMNEAVKEGKQDPVSPPKKAIQCILEKFGVEGGGPQMKIAGALPDNLEL